MTTSSSGHCHGLITLAKPDNQAAGLGAQSYELYLQEFVHRLQQVLRGDDRLIKLAADKYCLLLREVEQRHHAELAVAKLSRHLSAPAEIVGERVFFDYTAALVLPDPRTAAKEMMQLAETALATALRTGRRAVVLDREQVRRMPRPDPGLLPRIESAIDQGEFLLYYQPKVDARYRTVAGAEGLVRWHDSKRKKVVGPGEFIATAEQSPLIVPLTETLLRNAVARCVNWAAPLSVAVNVPPVVLETGSVVGVVGDVLEFYGLQAERLVLEITERGELPANAIGHLHKLRELGVKIAIDDFGTGQCSLSYFRDLPADEVKIDQSFVAAMRDSAKDCSIIRGCIDLAHHCDMQVTAEGVEDEACADMLTQMGCNVLQGYLFGRPEVAEEFEQNHLSGLLAAAHEADHFSRLLRS